MRNIAFVFGVCLLFGCGASAPPVPELPDLVPGTGTVTLDGEPLEGAVVIFTPKAVGGFPAMGGTDAQGKYELTTRNGNETAKGLAPGEYKVIVSRFLKPDGTPLPPNPDEPPAMSGAIESLPEEYSNPNGTRSETVGAEGGTFDFDIKSS